MSRLPLVVLVVAGARVPDLFNRMQVGGVVHPFE
jgi:hypothetical protein